MEQTGALTETHWQRLADEAARLASASGPSLVDTIAGFPEVFPGHLVVLQCLAAFPVDADVIEITSRNREVLPVAAYAHDVGEGKVRLDLDAVAGLLDEGATILLPKLNRSVAEFAIPDDIILPASYESMDVFAFISSPATQSYGAHHDLIDALIVQVSGTKSWRAWDVAKGIKPGDGTVEYREEALGAADLEISLRPGQIIRLPRNAPHVVRSRGEVTFHLAVGFRRPPGR